MAIGMANVLGDDGIAHVNSKSALFQQSVIEMLRLIELLGGRAENIMYAAGDLDVTVAGGRSRSVGELLGEGYTIDEAEEKLAGETLEAVVIAKRTAAAVKKLAERGVVNAEYFPLLMHMNEILVDKAPVNVPWKDFETVSEAEAQ